MIKLNPRQRVLAGAALLVTVAWLLDRLSGANRPATAAASSAPAAVAPPPTPAPASGRNDDVKSVLERLLGPQPLAPALPIGPHTRDAFALTPQMRAALVAGQTDERTQARVEQAAFEERYRLQAVLTGRVPLAIINDAVYGVGAELDGYEVLEIHGDRVLLGRGEQRVILTLRPPGQR